MNRGVEIAPEAADLPASLITRQVKNGVLIRMAVLFHLLGAPGPGLIDEPDLPESAGESEGAGQPGSDGRLVRGSTRA